MEGKKNEPGKSSVTEGELKYRTMSNQSPDGILVIDTKGNILDFNTSAHAQLGYTREEFARLRLADLDPTDTQEEIEQKIKEGLQFISKPSALSSC